MTTNDGGSAFPFACTCTAGDPGMSLRDWFAGMALQGWLANPTLKGTVEGYTKDAYVYADSMLTQREK